MDDFIGRRNLIAPETLRELTRRSDWKGAMQTLEPLRRDRGDRYRAVDHLGLVVGGALVHCPRDARELPLRRPARVQSLHRVRDPLVERPRQPDHRVRAPLPAQPRALVPLRAPSPHPGLGARSGADAPSAVHAVGLSPLPLRSELLVVPAGAALAPRAGQSVGRLFQRGAAPPHHARSPLAHRGICARRRPFGGVRVLGCAHPVARADALYQGAAPGAEHHRAHRRHP